MIPTARANHSESLSHRCPQLLDGIKLWELPGSIALPAETISLVSMFALATCLAVLLRTEATRYFFRLSFHPAILAAPASLLGWYIAWRGSLRPGPIAPRLWAASLAIIDTALVAASFLTRLLPESWTEVH